VEPVVSDPLDELAAPDVISSGGEDFGAFAISRWPRLVRLACGLTGDQRTAEDIAEATLARAYVAWRRVRRADDPDAYLRRALANTGNRRDRRRRVAGRSGALPRTAAEDPAGLLPVTEPPPAPLDTIIRRGKGIRLRRTVAAVGCLSLGGIIAAAAVLAAPSIPAQQEPALPAMVPAGGTAGPDGVFASGTVDGHAWRLAVQDIADPGYGCIPAITINGTDADRVYPGPENGADVALGPAEPGVGFAFLQLPAEVEGVVLDGRESLPATTATVCGQRYRVVGFAFRLTHQPHIDVVRARPSWPRLRMSGDNDAQDLLVVRQLPLISTATGPRSQTYGRWNNVGTTGAETASPTDLPG
jgi:Sigma-70 region 2